MSVSKIEKGLSIMNDSKISQWRYVNVENEFDFMGETFVISNDVEEYKVHNKASEVYDFTNEAYMEEILIVIDSEGLLKFYNQNFDPIDNSKVKVKG